MAGARRAAAAGGACWPVKGLPREGGGGTGRSPANAWHRTRTLCPAAASQDSPFFTVKLGIKVLPCVVFFKHGRTVDRVVGFDALGGKDDFATAVRRGVGREGVHWPAQAVDGAGAPDAAAATNDVPLRGAAARRRASTARWLPFSLAPLRHCPAGV